jgi:quercetin dioxygenase-like cupin family protein
MVTVLDGELEIRIGGTPHRVATGEAVVMPATIPHALRATLPTRMMLVMIRSSSSAS